MMTLLVMTINDNSSDTPTSNRISIFNIIPPSGCLAKLLFVPLLYYSISMHQVRSQCDSLLKNCQNNLEGRDANSKYGKVPKIMRRKIDAEQGRMELGPQELEENAKIIDKFRKKYHKKSKEHVIKKTNLGEDQLTFTPEEYARLQLIDEYQEKGFKYRETITEEVNNDIAKKSAVDRLKQLAKLDDVMEEVRCNFEWGTLPEHMRTTSNMVKSASSKQLGFQKRIAFQPFCNNLLNIKTEDDPRNTQDNYKPAKSLNKYYFTLLNKRSVGKKQFLFTRAETTGRAEELSLGQKIELIKKEAEWKSANLCRSKSPFMTEERKEAIFGCQMMRQAKKILKPSEIEHLQFSISDTEGKLEEQREDRDERREKQDQNCEAQEILQKNYIRIKAQRKRVIQKMLY